MTCDQPTVFCCPVCHQTQRLQLACMTWLLLSPHTAQTDASFQFTADSEATCPRCEFSGAYKDFNPAMPDDPDVLMVIEPLPETTSPPTTYH